MRGRIYGGLMLLALALFLTVGSGPVRGAQPAAPPDAAGLDASPGATAPWFIETVDPGPSVGTHVSIAIDPASGTTYISYYDAANKDLKMAKQVDSGGNCGPDNDWSCETVDNSSSDVGQYSSIAIDPTTSLPVIAYWSMVPNDLKLARAWGGGWDIIEIDEGSGRYASLKIDSLGAAHIAYHRSTFGLVYAKHVAGGTGNCGGSNYQCDTIDDGSGVGQHASLALDASGQPRIAYYGETGDLWYAQPGPSGNCGPGNTWGCYPVSASSDAGQYASLAVDSGNISHIAYRDAGQLAYAVWVGSGGNCGFLAAWQCDEIDSVGTTSHTRDVSLAMDQAGLPIIVYHRYIVGDPFTVTSFNLARPAATLGLESGNCGPQDLWQCERIRDSGHAGDYAAIAIHPSGLASIAYYKSEHVLGTLRIAYQRFPQFFLPLVLKDP